MFNLNIIIALILLDMIHNNIQIHNNVLWDRQYFTKYSLIFCTFSIKFIKCCKHLHLIQNIEYTNMILYHIM